MKEIYLGALSLAALAGQAQAQQKHPRPNILWLTYEDTSPEFIGCYGNTQARTPNIDTLASQGVRFMSAYSTGAVSAASRFCIITGIPADNMGTGNHRSNYKIPEEVKGFPYYLRQAGYYTTNNSKTDYNLANAKEFTHEAWNESSGKAGWWGRKAGQPFFAVYNSMSSHQSRTMTNTWESYEKLVLDHLPENERVKEGSLKMPSFFRDSPEMQKNMSRVYNSIALMDKEFGQWLARLEKDGLRDSTIIFCFADHGEGITRSKGTATTTGYRVPFVVWIPPIYKDLSPWGTGVITDKLVSFEDLAPTVLSLAGVEIPAYMKGHVFMGKQAAPARKYIFSGVDRTDESSELSRSVSDGRYLYTRVFMPFQPFVRWNMYYDESNMQQDIRSDYKKGLLDDKQRAILEPRAAEYLFDMQANDWGVKNLAADPAFGPKVAELRNAMVENILKNRDPHFMTEYVFQEEKVVPAELAADKTAYPLGKILDAALLSGEGEKVIPQQMKALSDSNPYVRYWAAVGLFSQRDGLSKQMKKLEQAAGAETFPPAQNTLYALLFKLDSKKFAGKIRQAINGNDPELIRVTLNLLITLDESKQRLFLADIKQFLAVNQNKKRMFACNDYMRLLLHKLENAPIEASDE